MKPVTSEDIRNLRHELGMTGDEFGKLLGFGNGAKVRISEIENGKPISRHVEVIYALLCFLKKHRLLDNFVRS